MDNEIKKIVKGQNKGWYEVTVYPNNGRPCDIVAESRKQIEDFIKKQDRKKDVWLYQK